MFKLPNSSLVQKVIPKNAFDTYTNTKQKKAFSEKILRITWLNKIAVDTVNLNGIDIQEIQVFKIELKELSNIKDLLLIMDKAIPYPILFWVEFKDEFYISTSAKHQHPQNENIAIIDYTFTSDWKPMVENKYQIELKNNLDEVFKTFCEQFTEQKKPVKQIKELVAHQKDSDALEKEIKNLESAISKCKQFNKKVDLNRKLQELRSKL
jgi:hypothetical protein